MLAAAFRPVALRAGPRDRKSAGELRTPAAFEPSRCCCGGGRIVDVQSGTPDQVGHVETREAVAMAIPKLATDRIKAGLKTFKRVLDDVRTPNRCEQDGLHELLRW